MRTTVEIPDKIFKKAKLKAVHEGVALKDVIVRALERECGISKDNATLKKVRAKRLFAALDKARNTAPVGKLKREEIYDRDNRTPLRGH